jgi:hypothetical protein
MDFIFDRLILCVDFVLSVLHYDPYESASTECRSTGHSSTPVDEKNVIEDLFR